jgi:hypothetical protein
MAKFVARQDGLFAEIKRITAPDGKCNGARVKISVAHDAWQTPMRTNFYGGVVTWADEIGAVHRRLLALLRTPLDVLETTACAVADQMAELFRRVLEDGETLESIIGTSTSDTEATAMKVCSLLEIGWPSNLHSTSSILRQYRFSRFSSWLGGAFPALTTRSTCVSATWSLSLRGMQSLRLL